ncbi:MAG: hypothetical protein K6G43_10105 [Lachnospiraceae bacterium]|nr:hypothetical protein [Lachnospiraceae bacterium]
MQYKELTYFFKYTDSKCIAYSVDNITYKFQVIPKYFGKLIKFLRERYDCQEGETDTRRYHYHYFFVIQYGKSSMRIEFSLNGVDKCRGKIIVNPNKCFDKSGCIEDLIKIRVLCNMFEMQMLDIALDISEEKSNVHMMNNAYRRVSYYCGTKRECKLSKEQKQAMKKLYDDNSNFITEYFGTKGHKTFNGFCKLYNKTFECGLDYTVTRFEITMKTCGKKCNSIKKIIDNLYSSMPKLFITHETDLSIYTNDKWVQKHIHTLEALSRFNNPFWAVQDMKMEHKNQKYSAYNQQKLLSYLNLEYISPERDVLENLLNECFATTEYIISYNLDDLTDILPQYFFTEDDVIASNEPFISPNSSYRQPLQI